jgi:hypothetical protein
MDLMTNRSPICLLVVMIIILSLLSFAQASPQTLEDRVDRYIASFPKHEEFHGVILAVPDYWIRHDKVFHTPRELLQLFSNTPLEHEPGKQFTYTGPRLRFSNASFTLAQGSSRYEMNYLIRLGFRENFTIVEKIFWWIWILLGDQTRTKELTRSKAQ